VWLFYESRDKRVRPPQCHLVIVDAEEQEQTVAGCSVIGTLQGRMILDTPLVKAEQHSSIRIEKLAKVGMGRRRRRLAEQRLVPLETRRHIANSNDRPRSFHDITPGGLTLRFSGGANCRPLHVVVGP